MNYVFHCVTKLIIEAEDSVWGFCYTIKTQNSPLKLKACPPFPLRPDQFNFLLLGSLQLKNGASDRLKKKNNKNQRGTGQIIWKQLENTRQNSQPQKNMHSCTNNLQIHNILYTERHRGPELLFHTAISQLIRHDSFVNSGLLTHAMVLWHTQEEVTTSSGVKKKNWWGDSEVRSGPWQTDEHPALNLNNLKQPFWACTWRRTHIWPQNWNFSL